MGNYHLTGQHPLILTAPDPEPVPTPHDADCKPLFADPDPEVRVGNQGVIRDGRIWGACSGPQFNPTTGIVQSEAGPRLINPYWLRAAGMDAQKTATPLRLYAAQRFPSSLPDIRAALGMTRGEMAAALGIKRTTYYKWEQGRHRPPEAIEQQAAALLAAHEAAS